MRKNYREQRENVERPLVLVSNILGPLISIIIFGILGNSFTIKSLRIVWFVGCGLEIIVGLFSLGFSERYNIIPVEGDVEHVENDLEEDISVDETASDDEDDDIDESTRDLQQTIDRVLSDDRPLRRDDAAEEVSPLMESLLPQSSVLEDHATAPPPPRSDTINAKGHGIISRLLTLLPTIMFVIYSLLFVAGGASFHVYWPVFIKDVASLPPCQLQLLYIIIPLLGLLCDAAFLKSIGLGLENTRIGINMSLKFVAALFVMIIGSDGYDNWEYGSSISLSVMFVLRMAFVNSAGHFRTFEDYIVTITNAEPMMWKQGMEMVTIVTWSIFSAVGGVWIESKSLPQGGYGAGSGGGGYGFVLRLTGALEFSGVVIMIAVVVCRDKILISNFDQI